jgi:hypothetical protein
MFEMTFFSGLQPVKTALLLCILAVTLQPLAAVARSSATQTPEIPISGSFQDGHAEILQAR